MMRHSLALAAVLAAASPAAAQQPTRAATHVPAVVSYGKWLLLGGAIGFNLAALRQHRLADDSFSELAEICTAADHARCDTGPDGSYLDPGAEAIYQRTLQADRRARVWLFAGETALLGSAAMFVWELSRPHGRDPDIPFTPRVGMSGGRTTLGLEIPF